MRSLLKALPKPARLLTVVVAAHALCSTAAAHDQIAFVSDGTNRYANWDIFVRDLDTSVTTQLTTHPAIDNHPEISPDGQRVVFSSNRGGTDFDLYLGWVTNVEATLVQLTSDAYPNGPQTSYPDRHPHWHPDGKSIVFSSKNRPLDHPIEVASECSSPIIITPPRFYEGMNVIQVDETGAPTNYVELDVRSCWDSNSFPNIWVTNSGTYVGHPSFNHEGNKVVFSAAIDGNGTVWEVYSAGYDSNAVALVPNSLRRVTAGPAVGPNPIQMSAGAHFSHDDSQILFSSTRTPAGNSQIFSVPAGSTDVPVTSATQITSHAGNDYVPEPISNGVFVVVSDLGTNVICGDGSQPGPTADLDLVLVDSVGVTRLNLTDNDAADEMLLIGDEVSWFCGLKPNLSACTYTPRIMRGEALWLEATAWMKLMGYIPDTPIPPDLLQRFNYTSEAHRLYTLGWLNLQNHLTEHAPLVWQSVQGCVQTLQSSGFPGLDNEPMLLNWLQMTESLRNSKFVVPSIMYDRGVGVPYSDTIVMRPARISNEVLEITVPVELVEMSLHSSTNLLPPGPWLPVSQPPVFNKGQNVFNVTIDPFIPAQFFRLENAIGSAE
jgi:hypothetical protein